jgi:hypothetical protein
VEIELAVLHINNSLDKLVRKGLNSFSPPAMAYLSLQETAPNSKFARET